jgi:adenylate kinase
VIIFMGVAGSGKSLQGRMLADELGLPWLSTGEFLRMLIAGDKRKEMLSGKLLDDHDMIALVQKIFTVVDVQNEFVLDGFPRSLAQADWLLGQVRHGQLGVTAVIHLQASEKVVEDRLLQRGRPDDHKEAIRERFQEYEESIKPILAHFKTANIPVFEINAEQTPAAVHGQIIAALRRVDDN